jgi:hypothetical protein
VCYKKWFNTKASVNKWCIAEKQMVFIGKMSWVIIHEFSSPQERNNKLEELKNAL